MARRLASERGINLSTLKDTSGSGVSGSFIVADLDKAPTVDSAAPEKKSARASPPLGSRRGPSPYTDTPVSFMREVSSSQHSSLGESCL